MSRRPSAAAVLRPFHRPRLWLAVWLGGWALCIALSLLPPPPMPAVESGDKIGHFLAYFTLSAWAMQIFASPRARLLAVASLVGLGVAMELGQGLLTSTRVAEAADVVANTVGVLLGFALAASAWSSGLLLRLDARLFAPARVPSRATGDA